MDNKITFIKLGDLVGKSFTVTEAKGYTWKMWDNTAKRMLISETFEPGYRKIYTVDTSEGRLDLSAGQLGQLLELTYIRGEAFINGRTFSVKSNGKTGMDIRYFFNVVRDNTPKADGEGFKKFQAARAKEVKETVLDDIEDGEPFDISSIPF